MPIPIDYKSYRSPAYNGRVKFLVMHYTAATFSKSIELLCGNASSHYVVPALNDSTYQSAGYRDMQVFNLVDEQNRAWHAGVSDWGNITNLNTYSIGIEVVNQASDDNGTFHFPDYEEAQVDALIKLANNIVSRYPDISPKNVVAHSDISVGRKSDPGPKFPWKRLFDTGVGAWYDEATKQKFVSIFNKEGLPNTTAITNELSKYGYKVEGDSASYYEKLVRAFQLHFRPSNYSGIPDVESIAILYALNEKYPQ